MIAFEPIEAAAIARLGGEAALAARLATPRTADELRAMPDDRYLSQMSLRIFRAGLKHSLVDARWPAFEEVFAGFAPRTVQAMPDEAIEALMRDERLIRHFGKLKAVHSNAAAMVRLAEEHGSMGVWLADWPATDLVGLWRELGRRFTQLGGNSGPYFLRMVGKDTFLLSDWVAKALGHWGVADGVIKTRAGQAAVQAQFNAWAAATGRPLCQLSQILASSID
jgi:3-methyladenine DNA glycosylase Tag